MNLRRTAYGVGFLGALALVACGGDDTTPMSGADASGDVSTGSDAPTTTSDGGGTNEAGSSEGGEGGLTPAQLVARGDYLVNHVAACPDCHTQHKMDGSLDLTKSLAGSAMPFADLDADPAKGAIYAKNLTPDMATGLGSWSDQEIKNAFLNGLAKGADGGTVPLFYAMPYYVFHNMSAQDADAIVAYLRSIPAVANAIPDDQPLPFPFPAPVPAFDATLIPDTTLAKTDPNYARAEAGKYLAGNVGICMECHTEHNMAPPILKTSALFGGNEQFPSASIGLQSPPFPAVIYSANITPDDTGLKDWVAADVAKVLSNGVNKAGQALCPPMPFGPMGDFGGLTADDQLNLGYYITSLPKVANPGIAFCVAPGAPPGDAGAPDATSSDGAAE